MRTNEPRLITSIRFLGFLSAAGAIGVALAACSSSQHLYPPDGGDGGATSSSGSGGPPPGYCDSNPDCTKPEKSVCDTVAKECVQCLVNSDCDQNVGLTCFGGACGCPIVGAAVCPVLKDLQCVDTLKSTVDCGTCGHMCFDVCEAGQCVGPWEPTSEVGAPLARSRHVAVWADGKMVVWGGRTATGATATGGVYDLAKNTWTSTSMTDAPSARVDATAVWDDIGKRMIVWGGRSALDTTSVLNTGARYDPAKNAWEPIPVKQSMPVDPTDTPSARWGHTGLWTGMSAKMIIWGGYVSGMVATTGGALFDPANGTWKSISALAGQRREYAATWTDTSLFVWGGFGNEDELTADAYLTSGSKYDPMTDTWMAISTSSAPSGRSQASAVWNGIATVVWGGTDGGTSYPGVGGRFTGTSWNATDNPSPTGRVGHSAVVLTKGTTRSMVIWGGVNAGVYLDSGYTLPAGELAWSKPLPTAPKGRLHHSTVVNGKDGSKMILWGGETSGNSFTNSGAIFDAAKM